MLVFVFFLSPAITIYENISIGVDTAYAAGEEPSFLATIGNTVGVAFVSLGAGMVWIGGKMLDIVINQYVVQMGSKMGSGSPIGNSIERGWVVIRDLMNIAFIFGFAYIGLRTILSGTKNAGTQRFLSQLVIAALLVNFSLFFARVIVDVSNVFTVEIYQAMTQEPGMPANITQTNGIAAAFMEKLGLLSLYSGNLSDSAEYFRTFGEGGFVYLMSATIFLLVAAFVFAAAAILLLVRFAALALLMVFSPIAITGLLFSGTSGYAKKLFGYIIKYAFFAPTLLLMFFISYIIINGAVGAPGAGEFRAALQGETSSWEVIVNFFLITLFMVISLVVANKFSVVGGNTTINVAQDLRRRSQRFAANSTIGLGAAGLRSSIGWAANKAATSEGLKDRAATNWGARQVLKGADYTSRASFDPRQFDAVSKNLGDEIGKGKKGGHAGRIKDAQKKEENIAKLLGTVGDDDVRVAARKQEADDIESDIQKLKRAREGTSGDDRRRLSGEISDKEKQLKDAREKAEREKLRRQLGSTFGGNYENAKEKLDEEKLKMREALSKYHSAKDASERDAAMAEAKALKAPLVAAREEYKKAKLPDEEDRGYFDDLKNRGVLYSTLQGRTVGINKTVADNLGNEYEKKISKTKEDKSTDAIVSAVKDTAKKDS